MWQPAHTRAFRWRFGSPSGDGAAAWLRERPAPARATSRAAAVASFREKARGTSLIFAPSYAGLNGRGRRMLAIIDMSSESLSRSVRSGYRHHSDPQVVGASCCSATLVSAYTQAARRTSLDCGGGKPLTRGTASNKLRLN